MVIIANAIVMAIIWCVELIETRQLAAAVTGHVDISS
jgi:hypothetical protein